MANVIQGGSNTATEGAERSPVPGSSIRPVTVAPAGQFSSAPLQSPRSRSRPNSQAIEPDNGQPEYVDNPQSDHAIPRKQIGPTSTVPSYPATQSSLPKPTKSVKPVPNDGYNSRSSYTADDGAWPMASGMLSGDAFLRVSINECSYDAADARSAQATVERAKTNSVQTHVNESIAPGMTIFLFDITGHELRNSQLLPTKSSIKRYIMSEKSRSLVRFTSMILTTAFCQLLMSKYCHPVTFYRLKAVAWSRFLPGKFQVAEIIGSLLRQLRRSLQINRHRLGEGSFLRELFQDERATH